MVSGAVTLGSAGHAVESISADAFAYQTGITVITVYTNLDEKRKQATRLEYAENMFKASGAVGQAAKEADQYANVQANLTEKWRQFKAQIGEPVLQNVVIPAMDKLSGAVDKVSVGFEDAKKWIGENKTTLTTLGIVIGSVTAGMTAFTIATKAQEVAAKLHTAATVAEKLAVLGVNTAMLASSVTWDVAGIVALIAVIVLLVKNWDKVKEVAGKVWEKIKEVWSAAGTWLKTNVIDPIANLFKDLWQKIKETWEKVSDWFKTDVIDPIVNLFDSLRKSITEIWNGVKTFLSNTWETIKNVFQVGLMFISELMKAGFNLIALPFRFIWENCKEYVFEAWESIKSILGTIWDYVDSYIFEPIRIGIYDFKMEIAILKECIYQWWHNVLEDIHK